MNVLQVITLICIASCLSVSCLAGEPYNGYKVLEIVPKTDEQVQLLSVLSKLDNVIPDAHGLVNHENYLTIPPTLMRFVTQKLDQHQLPHRVVIDDLQAMIDRQRAAGTGVKNQFDFDIYNDLDSIYAQLDVWISTCPSGLSCELSVIGQTYEGVDIKLYKIGSAAGSENALMGLSLIHAREWIVGATVMKILDHLFVGYGSDDDVTRMLDTYDIYIIPILNPDGYIRSWTVDRMQRKNRTPNEGSDCFGTDLNRNNDYLWGLEGTSFNPCSDSFCGSSGASELETQAYNAALLDLQSRQTVWTMVDFHNYGRMWMHPWGYTENHEGEVCVRADDHDEMYHISEVTSNAIMATHDTTWAYGTSCEVIMATTGGTKEWAKELAGVKYTFTTEMRGNGFVTDEEDIQLSYEEIWNGLVAMADEIAVVHELPTN